MSEWWEFVAFGDVVVVEFAFGFDAFGEVFGSGASAFGHHEAAVAAWPNFRFASGCHRVPVGWHSVGNSRALPGLVV